MTLTEISERIGEINEAAELGDFEKAHSFEDMLRKQFLQAVVDGKYRTRKQMIEAAKMVLIWPSTR